MDERTLYRYIALASLVVTVVFLLFTGFPDVDKGLPLLNKIVDYGILPFIGTWFGFFAVMGLTHFVFQYLYINKDGKPINLIALYVFIIGAFVIFFYTNVLK